METTKAKNPLITDLKEAMLDCVFSLMPPVYVIEFSKCQFRLNAFQEMRFKYEIFEPYNKLDPNIRRFKIYPTKLNDNPKIVKST